MVVLLSNSVSKAIVESVMIKFQNPDVEKTFAGFPQPERRALLQIRAQVFAIASQIPKVGPLDEDLRWGQPAYLTPISKSGSTLRLGVLKTGGFAVFTHCQTTIMSDLRMIAPELDFEGNRAVLFAADEIPPMEKLDMLIRRALTYHL